MTVSSASRTAISEAMRRFSASIAARSSPKAKISAWASARVVGSSASGIVIGAISAESPPISQTFQRPDSIRRSWLAHRLWALHNHRTHLRPVQPVDQREQLRMVELHPGRRNLRPAELCLLERLGKQAYPTAVPPNRLNPIRPFPYNAPLNGSAPPSRTSAIKPIAPLRKSTGVLAT